MAWSGQVREELHLDGLIVRSGDRIFGGRVPLFSEIWLGYGRRWRGTLSLVRGPSLHYGRNLGHFEAGPANWAGVSPCTEPLS